MRTNHKQSYKHTNMKGANNKGTHKPKTNQNTRHTHYNTANKMQDTYTMTQQTHTGHIRCNTANKTQDTYTTIQQTKRRTHTL